MQLFCISKGIAVTIARQAFQTLVMYAVHRDHTARVHKCNKRGCRKSYRVGIILKQFNPMKNAIDIIKKQIQGNYPDKKFRFDKFDVKLELKGIEYHDLDVKDQKPIGVQTSIFTNDTNVEDQQTFVVDKTTSDSFTWSLTEGLEVGTEFEVKVPFIGDSKSSIKLNFSSTQSQTTSVERHWGYSALIPVPAHSKIETSFSVLEGKIDTPFTATFQVRGYMKISFDISGPGQKADWRYCQGEISEMIRGGYCVSDPKTFECNTSGVFNGIAATTYVVHTKPVGGEATVFARGEEWDSQPMRAAAASLA